MACKKLMALDVNLKTPTHSGLWTQGIPGYLVCLSIVVRSKTGFRTSILKGPWEVWKTKPIATSPIKMQRSAKKFRNARATYTCFLNYLLQGIQKRGACLLASIGCIVRG